ncbi:MAG: hypothetical protein ACYC9M_07910 [Desulfobulbaceae bacterium]
MFRNCGFYFAAVFAILAIAAAVAAIEQGPFVMGNYGSISGQILIDGKEPMPGGLVGFFNAVSPLPPKSAHMHRIPDRVATVDQQGRFAAKLPPGGYYLGVIIRDDLEKTGPPGPEERSFAAVDEGGGRKIIRIGSTEPQDLGAITVSFLDPVLPSAEMLTIRGRVINKDGQPFTGASILVRRHPEAKRPILIAGQNGKDGQYELQLPAGGPYYLIAKEVPGNGRPQTGRHVGAYTGAEPIFDQRKPEPKPAPLSGRAGETLSGITILMIEVPDSEQRKEILQTQFIELSGTPGEIPRE